MRHGHYGFQALWGACPYCCCVGSIARLSLMVVTQGRASARSLQGCKQRQRLAPTAPVCPCACRVDDKLYEIEADPSNVHVALYRLSTGPVGQATTQVGGLEWGGWVGGWVGEVDVEVACLWVGRVFGWLCMCATAAFYTAVPTAVLCITPPSASAGHSSSCQDHHDSHHGGG
jgi:hypothetical protein